MRLNLIRTSLKGFIHYVNGDYIIRSYKGVIYVSHNGGQQFFKIIDLAQNILDKIKLSSRLFRRLLRFYIYHALPIGEHIIVFGLKKIFVINSKNQEVIRTFPISGSRPLCVCSDGEYIYYGEYFSNHARKPVAIYRFKPLDNFIDRFTTISGIRHIHGMFYDPISHKVFLTTGDLDNESFIGYLNSGKIVKYLGGSQQTRVVTLLFEKSYIYFATDAPNEINYIYRISRANNKLEKLQKVGGTVFYGTSVNGTIVFSTVADTNKKQREETVELWTSQDGINWKMIKEFKKDIWPKKLFQHGQLLKSNKQYNSSAIWFTPFATKNDQIIYKMNIDQTAN